MKSGQLLLYLFCLIIFWEPSSLKAIEEVTGTLIVSYGLKDQKEILNRIRFWLRDSKYCQKMYPQGNAFLEDRENCKRIVIIKDLPPGHYQIEFIVPNRDQRFEEVNLREFDILGEEVVKIDQTVSPKRKEAIFAFFSKKNGYSFLSNILEFKEKEKTLGGKLFLSYDAGERKGLLSSVFFEVRNDENKFVTSSFNERLIEDPLTNGYLVFLPDLALGKYHIRFYFYGNERGPQEIARKDFVVENESVISLQQQLFSPLLVLRTLSEEEKNLSLDSFHLDLKLANKEQE